MSQWLYLITGYLVYQCDDWHSASYWNLAQLLYRYSPGGATSPLQLSGTLITT